MNSAKCPLIRRSRVAAVLSALSMGLGQMYNRQWVKGGLLLGLQIAYIVVFYPFFNIGLWGIATLGTIPQVDNSLDLMAEGIISILLILFGLGCYGFNIRDAYKVGKLRERGVKPPGVMQTFRHVTDQGFPYLVIGPAMILLVFVVLFPILFMIVLAFTNYDLYHQPPAKLVDYVGLDNFVHLFQLSFWKTSFFSVLCWTVVWTLVSTTVQVILGLFLAVILNQKKLKFKKFFRTILILPWAVPSFVSIIVFSGLFDNNFGTVNLFLQGIGLGALPWMTDPFWAKIAILLIQFWLGFPFSMALYTGVLQAISADLYEAAEVDGATIWQKFRHITLPMALYATAPLLIVQYVGNFNNFNVIYLFNKGLPAIPGQTAGGTDILISWVYKLTFETSKYNYAAAISVIIGLIVTVLAVLQFRGTRSFKEEGMIR
ncbi:MULTISPECIES: sugar ABC transporter permease [unclassified Thermoactinomyces]|jgi:arabinogalactan oligomer / maltooligosaccharide transport system permease protein|uniref:sugar ABC transporter permease n=1 Tax=unclassified Thermoactinomyces TaxID=2634588 RepID=UPI0018DE201D|nr:MULTISPECIES: sugar ABC transporter permease [unclassified Thermoactinomyces]MBH8597438.1 sugar ABC transporter permease [Thermoactinomyces sp. CICC 10523]MBH8602999.1 sugar ABC transporter permease [Thermoactinomyces sp. CICC 10522]MBH8607153.1 sugar ABC transporter permease [Thermoactinomyces sp. CICC 10521]